MSDDIDRGMQRLDVRRVIELALASCEPKGPPFHVDSGELLRNIEEGGYTFRLTTGDERREMRERSGE